MKTILLTGGRGFIGSNLKRLLANEYTLLFPTSAELNLFDSEAVRAYLQQHPVDFIIHGAAVGGVRGQADAADTVEKNMCMLDNLLTYKNRETKIITFSSGTMYNRFRPLERVKESEIGMHIPKELHGVAKLNMAQTAKARTDTLCLVIFSCYGYGEKSNRVPSYCIGQTLKGEDIVIEKNARFDYLWIDDLVEIIRRFLKHWPTHRVINVTPDKSVTLGEIAERVKQISGSSVRVVFDEELNNAYTGDNSVLLSELPDFTFTPLETGLTKLYRYIQQSEQLI